MKYTLIFLILLMTTLPSMAAGLPFGRYKTVDAYCTNPDYVYSKEEKDYINTLKGIDCGTSSYLDPACFEDYYEFSSFSKATLVTRTIEEQGLTCTVTQEATWSEDSSGLVTVVLGKSTTTSESNNPDNTISCSSNDEGNKLDFKYKEEGKSLILLFPSSIECGEFAFKLITVAVLPK